MFSLLAASSYNLEMYCDKNILNGRPKQQQKGVSYTHKKLIIIITLKWNMDIFKHSKDYMKGTF